MQRLAADVSKITLKNGIRFSSQVAQRQYYDVEKLGYTETGFPKFPKGTRISKKMIMGDYGPYDPKFRETQEYFQKQVAAGVPSYLVFTHDKVLYGIVCLVMLYMCVMSVIMTICFTSKKFCNYIPFNPKT
uniref:Uncharacterized protein n=1 Tax=Romanomermis culicivorax TaxID=13658 RepID=A0A915HJ25_ROMCU